MTDERTAINLAAALKLADAGLPVFAAIVTYDEKGRGWEKQPAFKGWQKDLTTDPAQIRQWWRARPNAVPGIDLRKAGLIVIDGDRHGGPDGVEAFIELSKQNPDCAVNRPVSKTAGNGQHSFLDNHPATNS